MLRGRDIKRFGYQYADLWIISTFPSLKIDIDKFPSVKQHLLSFGYDRLKQTGGVGSRKKTNNKWFETQDSISYWDDFSKQKIIWIELVDKGRFAVDRNENYLTLNGTFIMTGGDLEYLCCILNNPVTSWHFNTFCISSGVGTNQWRELYVKELFIPHIKLEERLKVLELFNNDDLCFDEQQQDKLNHMVYDILNLNEEEIAFIQDTM
ncbi:MAG: TaqI-like C-terminal specificity domain-containing protein [Bacteroidota bacterium]